MDRRNFIVKFFLWFLAVFFGYKVGTFEMKTSAPKDSVEEDGIPVSEQIKVLNEKLDDTVEKVEDISVNIKDFGAVCDGKTDDTISIRKAIAYAEEHNKKVLIPGVSVISEEIEIKKPIIIEGIGSGAGYGPNILTNYRQISGFLVKGTGKKRIRTRRLYRGAAKDPQDPPLSVAINVQSEHVTFRNFSVFLDFNRNDNSPTNYGAKWDCGIFVGCRSHFYQENIHVMGYWREASWYYDVTYGAGLPRFNDINGEEYDNNIGISGADGCTMMKCLCLGGMWGIFVAGALPKKGEVKYSDPYYDELMKKKLGDNRGAFGFSDFTVISCSIYGTDHHSKYRRNKPTGNYLTDQAGGAMFVDGMAGIASGVIQGHRYISTRFASWEAYTVKLGRTQRDQFIGCHFENRMGNDILHLDGSSVKFNSNDTYGLITATDRTNHIMVLGSPSELDRNFIPPGIRIHNMYSAGSSNTSSTTDTLLVGGLSSISGELDIRSESEDSQVRIRNGANTVVTFEHDINSIFRGDLISFNDNDNRLGSSSRRWQDIYAANGTIQTSDRNSKQQIQDIPDKVLDAWAEVNYSQFKFNSAVDIKGSNARWHFGIIAQEIQEKFKRHRLDALEYGLLCFDEWEDVYDFIEKEEEQVDEHTGEVYITKSKEKKLIVPAGKRYSIRPDECLMLEAALMRRELQRIKKI